MPDLRIAHLRKHYRLAAGASGDRPRLDRVLQTVLERDLFEAALARAGVSSDDEICIRRVESAVRLERSQADAHLAAAWSVALADGIARELQAGGPNVVRYGSRFLALVDMTGAAARGDFERAWAWRALGLCKSSEMIDLAAARAEALVSLARHPRMAPAVLGVVAQRGLLPLLLSRVPAVLWVALARAALAERGASAAALRALTEEGDQRGEDLAIDEPSAEAVRVGVARVERASSILRGIPPSWPGPRRLSAESAAECASTAHAFAALAMLECEPGLLGARHATVVVRGLAQRLTMRSLDSVREATVVLPHRQIESSRSAPARARDHAPSPAAPPVAAVCADADLSSDDRRRFTTAFGGLLFLLHLVRDLDLPSSLVQDPALAARSLPWTLYQLALRLVPVDSHDAAALAFAGLAPEAPLPTAAEPPPTEEQAGVLREARDRVAATLRGRLPASADESDEELTGRVASRRAEVIAEPTWIELRFAAADVSTEVRRAGLDLDPGWLPWLGVVVRFVYV